MRSFPLLSLAVCLCIPTSALAEEAASPDRKGRQQDIPLEVHGNEILVYAPRIRGQLDVPEQPIEVFDEEDIASYGVNSIEELIDAISPQTTSGRGRGDGRPVILVNGQRITNFREMRNIPPEAIRRLEVLPEEVALRFGYPPNQRVVNIILKDQFASVTGSGEYNRPTRGGYDNYELSSGLFRVSGPRRYNVTAKVDETSMLTEAERDVLQKQSATSQVAGDPDPARYRSLAAANHQFTLEGTMTQGMGKDGLDGSITASGGYTHTETTSWSGLDTVTLHYDDQTRRRTLPDPLTTEVITDEFDASLGYGKMLGGWQLNVTSDGSYVETNTDVDRRRTVSSSPALASLVSAAAAGELPLDGPLPFIPGVGVDTARNRTMTISNLVTLVGKPFHLPAGDASLTLKAGYDFNRTLSDDTRNSLGTIKLLRGDVQGGVDLALPLTSGDFLSAIGALTFNVSGGADRLSDFGTLKNWSAGFTWSPSSTLTFQASYLANEAAPTLAQLGGPTILNYNVPVYDFAHDTTALVTVTTGGNPDLVKEKQRDIKLSATWKLPFLARSNLVVEYFHNRSTDVTEAFPLLTPAIEAAFPGRVLRDEAGDLLAIDRRAVTFHEVSSSRLRWGVNLSGSLGGGGSGAGGRAAVGSLGDTAPARAMPEQSAVGSKGPMPGAPGVVAPDGRPSFDSSRFVAIRQQLCTPTAGPSDLSNLPERLRVRLAGPDGKIDPEKLAQFKARVCSAEGQGGFDPERMARLRTLLCSEGTPDLTALPERMADRLRSSDGKIDPARLAQARQRLCAAPAPSGAIGGPPLLSRDDAAPPAIDPRSGTGRAEGGMAGSRQSDENLGRTSDRAAGRGSSTGFGGPMMGARGGRGSRWNLSIYHTWRFTDRVQVIDGGPVLNELAGDAIAAGGVPRHSIEAEGGLFKNGYGLRLQTQWNAPARVNGGRSNLRFGSTLNVTLRVFADMGHKDDLVSKVPFFKGARISLKIDNLLDSRQRVTDQNGAVPIAYQPALRDPQGRVIGIDFRKMF